MFANTKHQLLSEHLFAVSTLSTTLAEQSNIHDDSILQAVKYAAMFHDIGKVDSKFQQWASGSSTEFNDGYHIDKPSKFSFEKYPRHNEISWLLHRLLNDPTAYNNRQIRNTIENAILWHHAKPKRKKDIVTGKDIYEKLGGNVEIVKLIDAVSTLMQDIDNISQAYSGEAHNNVLTNPYTEDLLYDVEDTPLPSYKKYSEHSDWKEYQKDILLNSQMSIVRAIIIEADRLISSLTADELSTRIATKTLSDLIHDHNNGLLVSEILKCLSGFNNRYGVDGRNKDQSVTAEKLSTKIGPVVLQGQTGYGKTKILLEAVAKTGSKKVLWICPRVQVCQGIYHDLQQHDYLPNASIEIHTGEFQLISQHGKERKLTEGGVNFIGDIIITTIDQLVKSITTHYQVVRLITYLNSYVVFDEFHELVTMPGFDLLFAELVTIKNFQNMANITLMSATPNYCFVKNILQLDKQYHVVKTKSFNKNTYDISFETYNDIDDKDFDSDGILYRKQHTNTAVISNKAITAQLSYILNKSRGEQNILFHSKFTKTDKQKAFDQLFENFNLNDGPGDAVIRSGPGMQASLNVTVDKMILEATTAENWIQRKGRLKRKGNGGLCSLTTATPQSIIQKKGPAYNFLKHMNCLVNATLWTEYLKQLPKYSTMNDVYNLYDKFYSNPEIVKQLDAEILHGLQTSIKKINDRIVDPICFPVKKTKSTKLATNSLRGDNHYVVMSEWELANGETTGYTKPGALTESQNRIKGYGTSERELLSFMAKKHHQIFPDCKKTYKDFSLLNDSKNVDKPIYLGYTKTDLNRIKATAHPYARYYVSFNNEPIGTMCSDKINLITDKIKNE